MSARELANGSGQTGRVGPGPPHVKLGEHDYPVYAQRHAYLRNRLSKMVLGLDDLGSLGADTEGIEGFANFLGDRVYDLIAVFIPRIMPRYEFLGYSSEDEMQRGDYDPERDISPSFPEIIDAIQTCMEVNRLDLLKHLGKVVDMDLVRAWINRQMAEQMERSMPSANSLPLDTDGTPTTSGMTPPTSTESEGSPSPESSTYSTPQSAESIGSVAS